MPAQKITFAEMRAAGECWHVYCGDVRIGTIAKRIGIPPDEDPWGWSCGFYPGSHPGECANGAAATFDKARTAFEEAWRIFLSNRTEANFQEWLEAQSSRRGNIVCGIPGTDSRRSRRMDDRRAFAALA